MAWNLYTVQKLGTYSLVAIAFLSLVLGGSLSPVVVGLCLIVGGISWFAEEPWINPSSYADLWRPLTLSLLVVLTLAVILGYLGPLQGGMGLVLYLMGAKLFQRERAADYLQALVLTFLIMALATIYNEDISFGFLFLVYVVIGLICFTLYHLRIQIETYTEAAKPAERIPPRLVGNLAGLGTLAIVTSLVFFFAFPRLGFGFLSQQNQSAVQVTGFSDEVNLGTFGTLKSDPTVIMRVEFPQGVPARTNTLYWKGFSFDRYDGVAWSRTLNERAILNPNHNNVYVVPEFALDTRTLALLESDNPPRLQQSIYIEPLNSTALFSVSPLLALQFSGQNQEAVPSRFRKRLHFKETGDISHTSLPQASYQYNATSLVWQWNPGELQQVSHDMILGSLSPTQQEAYLQVPDNLSVEVRELATSVTEGLNSDYEKTTAIRDYLLTNFAYSLELPNPGNQPPIDAFLFDFQRGHCEYFSTAMAMMLRAVGIPVRSVNGFLGGRWNEGSQYLAVRNADAHSWLEVPFGEYGWVTFDPTPAAANVSQVSSWLDPYRSFYDNLRFQWLKYVIQYDLQTQMQLLQKATASLAQLQSDRSWNEQFKAWIPNLRDLLEQNWIPSVIVLLSSFSGGVLGHRRRLQRIRWQDGGILAGLSGLSGGSMIGLWQPAAGSVLILVAVVSPSLVFAWIRWGSVRWSMGARMQLQEISRFYQSLQEALGEVGITIEPYQGPVALIVAVQSSDLAEADEVATWIKRYMDSRFGGRAIAAADLKQMRETLSRYRVQWRQLKSQGSVGSQPAQSLS